MMFRKAFRFSGLLLTAALVLAGCKGPALKREGWSEEVYSRLTEVLSEQDGYVVFDCDNTTIVNDISNVVMLWQIEHLVFADAPDRLFLDGVFPTDVPFGESGETALSTGLKLQEEYRSLRALLDGGMDLPEVWKTDTYLDYRARFLALYKAIGKYYDSPTVLLWMPALMAGFTEDEARAIVREAAVDALREGDMRKETWTAPAPGTQKAAASGTQQAPASGTQQTPASGAQQAAAFGAHQTPASGTQQAPASGAQQAPASGTQNAPDGNLSVVAKKGMTIMPRIRNLYSALEQRGIDAYVCSASLELFVETLLCDPEIGLGLPEDRIFGIRLARSEDGRILPYYEEGYPQPYRSGKTECIRTLIAPSYGDRGPLLVAGDSSGDVPMLTDFPDTRVSLIVGVHSGLPGVPPAPPALPGVPPAPPALPGVPPAPPALPSVPSGLPSAAGSSVTTHPGTLADLVSRALLEGNTGRYLWAE